MRILMVTPEFPPGCGGIGYYVFYLSLELVRRGVQVKALVRKQKPELSNYQDIEVEAVSIAGVPPFNNHSFRRCIESAAASWGADLVHVHASSMPAPKTNRPLVVTSHSCIGAITPLFYRPVRDAESFYRNLLLPLYTRVERQLVTSCDKLTVVSRSMAEDYKRLYGVDSEAVWNGVDTDRFRPATSPPPATPRVAFIGALKRGKGVLDLLEAARLVSRRHPMVQFQLYGVGPMRRILEALAVRHNLGNFRLLGSVEHDKLPSILAASTAVVLPSYYEGLPNTILEAMASGIPVVATAVKGNAEIVQEGVTGFLVPPRHPSALAEAICRILETSDHCRRLGLAGRRIVEENFTWGRRVEQFIDLYERTSNGFGTARSS